MLAQTRAMIASPLMIGADMRDMAPEFRAVWLNKELIRVNQVGQHLLCDQSLFICTGTFLAVELWYLLDARYYGPDNNYVRWQDPLGL